jgi:hypothetical protein
MIGLDRSLQLCSVVRLVDEDSLRSRHVTLISSGVPGFQTVNSDHERTSWPRAWQRQVSIVIKCHQSLKDSLRPSSVKLQSKWKHSRIKVTKMAVGDLSSKRSLVPVVAALQPTPLPFLSHLRSEAPFLTHLIVTADPIHKGRSVRRPTPRQAQAAYKSTDQNVTAAQITMRPRSA